MAVDNLNNEVFGFYIFLYIEVHDFAFVVVVVNLFFHHTFTHGCHLGTAVGVYNRSDNVAAESGTNLVKEVLILFAGLGVGVVAYFKRCAVGGESAVQAG